MYLDANGVEQFFSGSRCACRRTPSPRCSASEHCRIPVRIIPTQVAMDTKNRSTGFGLIPPPPFLAIVRPDCGPSKCASTRFPGKVTVMLLIYTPSTIGCPVLYSAASRCLVFSRIDRPSIPPDHNHGKLRNIGPNHGKTDLLDNLPRLFRSRICLYFYDHSIAVPRQPGVRGYDPCMERRMLDNTRRLLAGFNGSDFNRLASPITPRCA